MSSDDPPEAGRPRGPVSPREIDELGQRVRTIRDEVVKSVPNRGDIEILVEQLGVAEEELHIQHEEIVATNAQLVAERQRYRELFDLAPDAYLVTDLAGAIAEANRAASGLLAVEAKYLARKPLIAYVVDPSRRAFREQLDAIARGCERAQLDLTLRGRDRALVDVSATVAPIQDANERCVGFRWLLRDVTRERAAHREVERLKAVLELTVAERTAALRQTLLEVQELHRAESAASRRKSEFLAFLSHEVRTPLQAIIGYSELLALEVHGPLTPEQASDLERMQRGQQHILRLLDEMLDYARIESGRVDLAIASLALEDICEVAADLVGPLSALNRVTIVQDVAGHRVRADMEKTRQIVMNLLTNALKFGPRGQTVRLSSSREGDEVVLAVEDEGSPIPPELRDVIFEPYVHVHQAAEGTGLGLPISRRLAMAMHGNLTLAPARATGNRFELRLPAA